MKSGIERPRRKNNRPYSLLIEDQGIFTPNVKMPFSKNQPVEISSAATLSGGGQIPLDFISRYRSKFGISSGTSIHSCAEVPIRTTSAHGIQSLKCRLVALAVCTRINLRLFIITIKSRW